MATKYIFVVGGVMSGVGKGVATASIGKILQSRGFRVTAAKIDPYVNVDAGTMNPTEHGEVFVLDDGAECDQDMGNYERFLNTDLTRTNYMTTGSVYLSVIEKERNLEYGGKQVEVVPRIPLEVIGRIDEAAKKAKAEIIMVEVGGTVGEYENILFLEAVRMLHIKHPKDVMLVLVSFIPALGAGGNELKTKPTQHAVRNLNAVGLHPDMILGRAHMQLDQKRKEKIAFMCSVEEQDVISAPNVENIYEVPLNFEGDHMSDRILSKLSLRNKGIKDLKDWESFVNKIKNAKQEIKIAIVGKYFGSGDFVLEDSYISVLESIRHAAASLGVHPTIQWLEAEQYEKDPRALRELSKFNGVIVPGGFGKRGVEGKIKAIEYCRTKKIPYFGLCYGMQLATIEFSRNELGLQDAHTTEVNPKTSHPIIDIMPEQTKNLQEKKMGGTMRLGGYACMLKKGTQAHAAYSSADFPKQKEQNGDVRIRERHRHRYELNNDYKKQLEDAGLVISGVNPERDLAEIIELSDHPFFVGTQFHPEFQSRPLRPHPLFLAFIKAAIK